LEFFSKDEIINNKKVRIKLWDTAGQEQYKALTKNFFRNSDGILITFDVTNRKTFDKVAYWMDSSVQNAEKGVPIILLGNKIDLNRQVSTEEAKKLADSYNIKYYETSAKNNIGIGEAIKDITKQVLIKEKPNEFKISLIDDKPETEQDSGCKC